MLNPFIGLILTFFLFSLLLKYAVKSLNLLQLELDKQQKINHIKVLNYISKRTLVIQFSLDLLNFITLSALVISTVNLYTGNFPFIFTPTGLFLCIATIILYSLLILITITIGEYFSHKIIYLFAIPLVIIHFPISPISKLFLNFYKYTTGQFNSSQRFDKNDLEKLVSERQMRSENNESTIAEIKLFQNALEFLDIKVRECIIPRTELVAIEITDIEQDLKQKFLTSGHSKILVYKESIDNIIGYIKSKSLFSSSSQSNNTSIKSLPIFPESMNLNKLLKYFIRTGQNMAIIVDEFGGTSGIVTTEDILEEIFGEIKDEHDTVDLYEEKLTDNNFIFSGRLEIDYINDKYNLNIPEKDAYETIAGYILSYTENIPKLNDTIVIDNFTFKILKVSNTRVELVKLDLSYDYI